MESRNIRAREIGDPVAPKDRVDVFLHGALIFFGSPWLAVLWDIFV